MLAHNHLAVDGAAPRPKYIPLQSAAQILSVDEKSVRRLIASGELAGYRLGKRLIRVREDELLALMTRVPTA